MFVRAGTSWRESPMTWVSILKEPDMVLTAFSQRSTCPLLALALVMSAGIAFGQQPTRPARGQAAGGKGQASSPREKRTQGTDGLRERTQKRAIFAKEVAKLSLSDLKAAQAANPRRTEDDQLLWEAQQHRIRITSEHAKALAQDAARAARYQKRKAMEEAVAKLSIPELRAALASNLHRTEEERILWLVQQSQLEKAEMDAEKRAKREELAKKRAEMKTSVAKLSIPDLEAALRTNPRKTADERMLWYIQKDRLGQARWEALSPAERQQIQNAKAFFFLAALDAISRLGGDSSSEEDPYREMKESNARKIQKDAYEDSLKYLPHN